MEFLDPNERGLPKQSERAMHGVWLVLDPVAFATNPGHASDRDRPLALGLTYKEWFALYFNVLGVDQEGYKKWANENPSQAHSSLVSEFSEEIPEYPLLSRIRGYLYDAEFRVNEIPQLRQECLRVRDIAHDEVALRGVNKLLSICDSAQRVGLNVYFLAD